MKKPFFFITLAILLTAALVCIFLTISSKGEKASTGKEGYWPDGSWRTSSPEGQGMVSAVLADMITSIPGSGKNIDSITIIRNGYLVCETYFYPYQKGYKHALYSCTKSFTSAVMGAAVEEGLVKGADDNVIGYFSDLDIATWIRASRVSQ